jgi:beta-phosphoglucomutase-like phosphatase (HAD superfamily)
VGAGSRRDERGDQPSLVTPDRLGEALEAITRYELETAADVQAMPGAPPFLRGLPRHLWCLVTSSRREVSIRKMDTADIPRPRYTGAVYP